MDRLILWLPLVLAAALSVTFFLTVHAGEGSARKRDPVMTIPDHVIEAAAKEIWAILGMDLEADIDRLFSDLTKAQQAPYLTAASFALAHALASLWQPIESTPINKQLLTRRHGEQGLNLCRAIQWHEDEPLEWVECGSGKTTVTHHSFAAPTHFIDPSIFPIPHPKGEG